MVFVSNKIILRFIIFMCGLTGLLCSNARNDIKSNLIKMTSCLTHRAQMTRVYGLQKE